MKKTSTGLVNYARSKIGTPYVYGAKMQVLTEALYKTLKNMYGSMVWDSDKNKIGKICCDCSGLISSYTGVLRNSSGYQINADNVHSISTIADAPVGALVWMQGHIGIYSGVKGGKHYYIAEDGSAYGCREVPLSSNKFTHWFLCKDIDYIGEGELTMTQYEELKQTMDTLTQAISKLTLRYNTIGEVPPWGQEVVKKLISKGYFADKNNLDLSYDMLREFSINDRAGLYD